MNSTNVYLDNYWVLRRYKPVLAIHFHAKANQIGITQAGGLFKIPRITYVVQRNIADMIRWESDRSKYMTDLTRLVQHHPGRINQLLRQGLELNRLLRMLMKRVRPNRVKRYSNNQLKDLLVSFDELIPQCWLQSTFLPYYVGDVKGFKKVIDLDLIRRLRLVTEADEAIPHLRILAREVLRRVGQQTRHPECTTYEELLACLQGRPVSLRVLEQRYRYCVAQVTLKRWKIETGTKAKQLAKKFKIDTNHLSVIRGMTVYPGHIIGKIFVAHRAADLKRAPRNCVLVTSMTTPDFVQYFSKVLAIITDEGGLTSHAAIVAREFHKPCVIGTKVATKVFKDGDKVEVDATNGIVKRI